MKLSIRALNAIWACAQYEKGIRPKNNDDFLAGPPKDVIASIPYARVVDTPNLGKKSLAEVFEWLADDGLSISGFENVGKSKKTNAVSQKRIDEAIGLLHRCGYTMTKPKE